jgi:hypothetical protein
MCQTTIFIFFIYLLMSHPPFGNQSMKWVQFFNNNLQVLYNWWNTQINIWYLIKYLPNIDMYMHDIHIHICMYMHNIHIHICMYMHNVHIHMYVHVLDMYIYCVCVSTCCKVFQNHVPFIYAWEFHSRWGKNKKIKKLTN